MSEGKAVSFSSALTAEIAASELMRVRVLAAMLAIVMVLTAALLGLAQDVLSRLYVLPVPFWKPFQVLGPFLLYELVVLSVLRWRIAIGRGMPTFARFGNAIIETSLPTVILWQANAYTGPALAFGSWISMLYFLFIVASTLRLDFVLPAFTAAVAAIEYLVLAAAVLPLAFSTGEPVLQPFFHITKAIVMLLVGIVAGLVGRRLRQKFERVVEEATQRERVTNLFGQHVSPSVVERLLDRPSNAAGELREICVMFLDIRDFTAFAREREPHEVVELLNGAFAFMIEAVDRHQGIVNKFLGDGFLAVFGAPLDDPHAARNAVAAAREILAEIDRRGLGHGAWRLRVGIGLAAGQAVTGNVGSPRRKEFTVIGGVVNLAARIEQLNKDFGSRLLVSETVWRALGAGVAATALTAQVKGYDEALPVWRLD